MIDIRIVDAGGRSVSGAPPEQAASGPHRVVIASEEQFKVSQRVGGSRSDTGARRGQSLGGGDGEEFTFSGGGGSSGQRSISITEWCPFRGIVLVIQPMVYLK